MRILSLSTLAFALSSFGTVAPRAFAAPPAASETSAGGGSSSANNKANACGCYEDSSGQCHCAKKSQCGCPGECEPAGCEQKRQKQLEKEADAELKQQQNEEKKRNAEMAKKREELEKQDEAKRERGLRGLRLIEKEN